MNSIMVKAGLMYFSTKTTGTFLIKLINLIKISYWSLHRFLSISAGGFLDSATSTRSIILDSDPAPAQYKVRIRNKRAAVFVKQASVVQLFWATRITDLQYMVISKHVYTALM
jgi:hypothetical protein